MQTTNRHRIAVFVAAVSALALVTSCSCPVPPSNSDARLLSEIEDLLASDALSDALWPDWEISSVPVAVYRPGEFCYLVGHPRPPASFRRVREDLGVRRTVYRAELPSREFSPESGLLDGVPTAYVRIGRGYGPTPSTLFRAAFRAHLAGLCESRSPYERVNLVTRYPVDPQAQALADIECLVLRDALLAPADSLEARVSDFVSIRCHRRIMLPPRFAEYERSIEYGDGLPCYVGDECAEAGVRGSGGRRSTRALEDRLVSRSDRVWYEEERFECTGAAVCALLDRVVPGWKSEFEARCVDPYTLLWEHTRGAVGGAGDVLERYEAEGRIAEKQEIVDESKSDAEKLFERIMDETSPQFRFRVNLLASASVSFDPENIERVDDYREVHKRILKIEYSGGTHVHIAGRPIAAVLGEGEHNFQELVCEAPKEYAVTLNGKPYALDEGIHPVEGEFSVEAVGLSLYARSAVVMVGHAGTTFILHR